MKKLAHDLKNSTPPRELSQLEVKAVAGGPIIIIGKPK